MPPAPYAGAMAWENGLGKGILAVLLVTSALYAKNDVAIVPGYAACVKTYDTLAELQAAPDVEGVRKLVEQFGESLFERASQNLASNPKPPAIAHSTVEDEEGNFVVPIERVPTLGGRKLYWTMNNNSTTANTEASVYELQNKLRDGKAGAAFHFKGRDAVRNFLTEIRDGSLRVAVDPKTVNPPKSEHPIKNIYSPIADKLSTVQLLATVGASASALYAGFSPVAAAFGRGVPAPGFDRVMLLGLDTGLAVAANFAAAYATYSLLDNTIYRPWTKLVLVSPPDSQFVPRINQMLGETPPNLATSRGLLGVSPRGVSRFREGDFVYWSSRGDDGAVMHLLFRRGGTGTEDELAVVFDGEDLHKAATNWRDHARRAGAGNLQVVPGLLQTLLRRFKSRSRFFVRTS